MQTFFTISDIAYIYKVTYRPHCQINKTFVNEETLLLSLYSYFKNMFIHSFSYRSPSKSGWENNTTLSLKP